MKFSTRAVRESDELGMEMSNPRENLLSRGDDKRSWLGYCNELKIKEFFSFPLLLFFFIIDLQRIRFSITLLKQNMQEKTITEER